MISDEDLEILLVEDNPADAEITLRAMKNNNIPNRVSLIKDGAEALDFIFCKGKYSDRDKNRFPKIIFLDLKLPKVDGLEVLRKVKEDPATKMIPICVLTSSSEEKDVDSCYNLGVNSYIVKPVDFNQFVELFKAISDYWLKLNKRSYN